jgi:hypothetical protein
MAHRVIHANHKIDGSFLSVIQYFAEKVMAEPVRETISG